MPRDLESIVLKAIAKSASERYRSAAEFAEDLRRFLRHQTPRATRTPLTVRVWKWGRRHRSLVAATALGCLVALLASGSFVWRSWSDAVVQRNAAQLQEDRAEANFKKAFNGLIGMLYRLGGANRPRTPEMAAVRDELLQDGLDYYEQFCQPDDPNPWIRRQTADAFTHKGYLWQLKGDEHEAIAQFRKSRDVLLHLAQEFPNDASYWYALGASEDVLALTYWENDKVDASAEHLQRSIIAFERALALDPRNVPEVNGYAWVLLMYPEPALRQPERAIALAEHSLRLIPDRAGTLWILGMAQLRAEQFAEASVTFQRVEKMREQTDPEKWLPLPYYWLPLAIALAHNGQLDESQSLLDRSELWLETHMLDHRELYRLRVEARQVLNGKRAIAVPKQ